MQTFSLTVLFTTRPVMAQLIAVRPLSAGDPLDALECVALRDDAPVLALRGIAMAQPGDYHENGPRSGTSWKWSLPDSSREPFVIFAGENKRRLPMDRSSRHSNYSRWRRDWCCRSTPRG